MRPYSKLALVDAFMHQAQTVPIDSITVKSLVAETEMNPKTSYYHFNGITDMLKWSFERELSALFPDSLVSAGAGLGKRHSENHVLSGEKAVDSLSNR